MTELELLQKYPALGSARTIVKISFRDQVEGKIRIKYGFYLGFDQNEQKIRINEGDNGNYRISVERLEEIQEVDLSPFVSLLNSFVQRNGTPQGDSLKL